MAKLKDRARRYAAKGMVILAGLFFGCIVAEIALRLIGYSYPIFYQTDAETGHTPIPNIEGWSWPENKVYLRYNSEGFRDLEHTKEKPADTIRIAVLGDSFAEARQVELEATFWSVLAQRLQESPVLSGKKVEVLNFGVSGYGTAEELLTLRQRVWKYSPDIVLLAVTTYNDITDNYRPFKNTEEIPYFTLQNGDLNLDASFRESRKYRTFDSTAYKAWVFVHNHSRLVQLLHHAQFAIHNRIQDWKSARRLAEAQKAYDSAKQAETVKTTALLSDAVGMKNMIYREPDDQYWEEAWQLTDAIITRMNDEARQHNAQLMIVTVTADIQVWPDPKVRQALADVVGVSDLFYPDRRLRSIAEREGMLFLDLAEPMQAAADRDKVFFHGFGSEIGNGHWNEAGHKFAGELMSKKLEELISK